MKHFYMETHSCPVVGATALRTADQVRQMQWPGICLSLLETCDVHWTSNLQRPTLVTCPQLCRWLPSAVSSSWHMTTGAENKDFRVQSITSKSRKSLQKPGTSEKLNRTVLKIIHKITKIKYLRFSNSHSMGKTSWKETSLKSLVQDYGDTGMLQVRRLSTLALASKAAISHLSLC